MAGCVHKNINFTDLSYVLNQVSVQAADAEQNQVKKCNGMITDRIKKNLYLFQQDFAQEYILGASLENVRLSFIGCTNINNSLVFMFAPIIHFQFVVFCRDTEGKKYYIFLGSEIDIFAKTMPQKVKFLESLESEWVKENFVFL